MRILRTSAFFVISVLVACGGGGKSNTPDSGPPDSPPVDTPPPVDMPPDMPALDFSCEGDPAATTAADPVAVSGTASDINVQMMTLEPVMDADVKAFKTGANKDTQIGATIKSDAQGNWTFSLATGATPLDGYVEASKTGQRTVRLYPPNPLAMDFTNVPLLLLAEGTFNLLLQFVLQDTQDPANGVVALAVIDCAGTAVSGATISVKQSGNEVGKPHEVTQLSAGAFFVLDVPPGDTVVSATIGTHTLHAHTVVSVAGVTTTTALTPHP